MSFGISKAHNNFVRNAIYDKPQWTGIKPVKTCGVLMNGLLVPLTIHLKEFFNDPNDLTYAALFIKTTDDKMIF